MKSVASSKGRRSHISGDIFDKVSAFMARRANKSNQNILHIL